jgi:ketosteroid isomerase-like protein
MSEENVEIVRRFIGQYRSAANTPRLVAEFWDPEADYYPVTKFPEARPCHGAEEITRFLTAFRDTWDRYEIEVKQLIPVSDDRVLAHCVLLAKGRESGVTLGGDLYQCVWLRRGRFLRLEDHMTLKGALRGLGLRGETLEATGLSDYTPSAGNLEAVKRLYTNLARGDLRTDADLFDPHLVFISDAGDPEGQVHYGREAFRSYMRRFSEIWEDMRFEAKDYRAEGNCVVVKLRRSAVGKRGRVPLEDEVFNVWTFRDRKAIRLEVFRQEAEALEAAGLPE